MTARTPSHRRPSGGGKASAEDTATEIIDHYQRARGVRSRWDGILGDCYALALPQRGDGNAGLADVYDGTAPDAVDQLAASLLAQLTPPWSRWTGFEIGPALADASGAKSTGPEAAGPDDDEPARDSPEVAKLIEKMESEFQGQIDRSNFIVEIHQCLLDLVVGGTACLLIEEAAPGDLSALHFTAIPLAEAVLEEGGEGRLETVYRRVELPLDALRRRFPGAPLAESVVDAGLDDPGHRFAVVEALRPDRKANGHRFTAVLDEDPPTVLKDRIYPESPFVAFRWLKAPGEVYGRSPVMKMLPDIRTANKVVELVLKNASIAVTGMWQADDDGVINPATVRIEPGTIIPKAVGSKGLTPLEAPGRFDVSQLVLDDLRSRIRRGLLADQLAQLNEPRMTATEVMERAGQMARLLGATYGRLQSELLTPLVARCHAILRRRGEIPDLPLDGETLVLRFRSPLAQAQAQRDVQNAMMWVESVSALGPDAMRAVDAAAMARWLAKRFGVPAEIVTSGIGDAGASPAAVTEGAVPENSPAGETPAPAQAAAADRGPEIAPDMASEAAIPGAGAEGALADGVRAIVQALGQTATTR